MESNQKNAGKIFAKRKDVAKNWTIAPRTFPDRILIASSNHLGCMAQLLTNYPTLAGRYFYIRFDDLEKVYEEVPTHFKVKARDLIYGWPQGHSTSRPFVEEDNEDLCTYFRRKHWSEEDFDRFRFERKQKRMQKQLTPVPNRYLESWEGFYDVLSSFQRSIAYGLGVNKAHKSSSTIEATSEYRPLALAPSDKVAVSDAREDFYKDVYKDVYRYIVSPAHDRWCAYAVTVDGKIASDYFFADSEIEALSKCLVAIKERKRVAELENRKPQKRTMTLHDIAVSDHDCPGIHQ